MAKAKKPKRINLEDLGGYVFSTNPDFEYTTEEEQEDVSPAEQMLHMHFEKNGRGGKQVVVIRNFHGSESAMKALGKELKQHCGVGGSTKNGEIILQGNVRNKATEWLQNKGYKTKRIGG